MAATGKPNHWDDLAEELGADVPPQQDVSSQQSAPQPDPQRQQPRPAAAARKTPSTQRKPKSPSANWGELASSLGVPGDANDPANSPDVGDVSREDAVDESAPASDLAEQDDDISDDGNEDMFGYDFEPDMSFECDLFAGGLSLETSSEPVPQKEESAQRLTPQGDISPTEADTEVEDDVAAEAVESEDDADSPGDTSAAEEETVVRKGRRRRRGRRGKRSGREAKDSGAETSAGGEKEGAALDSDLETVEDVLIDLTGEEVESNQDSESSTKRPKRKRRRRGGRKMAAKKVADDDDSGDSFDESADDVKRPRARSDQAEVDEVDSKSGSDRGKHRAIPSWGEAIGVIIEANLDSRAKKPSSSAAPSRGRGRRGRGRSSGK